MTAVEKIQTPDLAYTPKGEIKGIVEGLRATFMTHKTRDVTFRIAQLKLLGAMITEHEKEWTEAIHHDLGRPASEIYLTEIMHVKNEVATACKNVKKWAKPSSVSTTIGWVGVRPKIIHDPLGVILCLSPWNYPLTLSIGPIIGAIAAGNTAVLKPSEHAMATAALFTRLFPQYLDQSCYRIINGAVDETTELLDQKWDHIFYTGSGMVGRIVATAAAKHLTPCVLELGGKSPVLVFDDANVKVAATRIIWSKFVNAGQTCIASDYVLCSEAMLPKLIEAFRASLKVFTKGQDPLLPTTEYSKIVNERQFGRLTKMLEHTKGNIAIGGRSSAETQKIEVTVLTGVDVARDESMASEIFGPLLPVVTFENPAEAIDIINKGDQPLAMYVFGGAANFDMVKSRTRSGSIVHNDTLVQFLVPGLPFNGVGPSGTGAYHGKFSFDCFSHQRSTLSTPNMFEPIMALRYPPYSAKKLKWLNIGLGEKPPSASGVRKTGTSSTGIGSVGPAGQMRSNGNGNGAVNGKGSSY
ncbi:uncharacterized protein L969DRAFT_49510 [Mixia osmundae IAM 14324]|uniref:Aldehyde dehydrogenase n=1 Tax=Mixia osmundae (strain CBS 9802 / IAM 14324 / JCM 22182 / KY 12970) TaxID=764103 RepID=G7E0X2_MIXOS|nr:uncharacterized protein L969DRAFT_49510 [Mixia osmundae IAM 14324]KEI39511.1 hypothetical protein L969DRAFT_49510 [Mixia osmundae IAM 14324]GAA96482.1 hypothetical protein E5Q_03150 [Mixia osmundae IAM 14324]